MKIICPHCGATKPATAQQAKSDQPITCPKCGKDMHLPLRTHPN